LLDLSRILGRFSRKKAPTTLITSVSIKYMGEKHGLEGMSTNRSVFELKIPFQNKRGGDMLADNLKRPELRVEAVKVSTPFELVGVSPRLPISVKYRESALIRLSIRAPEYGYAGPIELSFS
jgi:hypothetical protein